MRKSKLMVTRARAGTRRFDLPTSVRRFLEQQETTPLQKIRGERSAERDAPFSQFWHRMVAAMLLSGRVKPKHDQYPNRTDVNRICKEANFNQHLFDRVAQFIVAARIVEVPNWRTYQSGPDADAFWDRDFAALGPASRVAMLTIFRDGIANPGTVAHGEPLNSSLDELFALFAHVTDGLAVSEDQAGHVLCEFAKLPARDLARLSRSVGKGLPEKLFAGNDALLAEKGQRAFLNALYSCEWAYVAEFQEKTWFFASDTARLLLGLDDPPPPAAQHRELEVTANRLVRAGIDLTPEQLVPLFRYCRIRRVGEVCEFQLDAKQMSELPSESSAGAELRAVLEPAGPLPQRVADLLAGARSVDGGMEVRLCRAIVKPENAEVLAAIRKHRRLKGYLEPEAPDGYLLIKPQSDPWNFVQRCRDAGFTVKTV